MKRALDLDDVPYVPVPEPKQADPVLEEKLRRRIDRYWYGPASAVYVSTSAWPQSTLDDEIADDLAIGGPDTW